MIALSLPRRPSGVGPENASLIVSAAPHRQYVRSARQSKLLQSPNLRSNESTKRTESSWRTFNLRCRLLWKYHQQHRRYEATPDEVLQTEVVYIYNGSYLREGYAEIIDQVHAGAIVTAYASSGEWVYGEW